MVVESNPVYVLTCPMDVTPKVLKKAGLGMDDMDIFEVNETFAPIPLAWATELNAPMKKLNVSGGAIALGNPVGSSGCRLSITAFINSSGDAQDMPWSPFAPALEWPPLRS